MYFLKNSRYVLRKSHWFSSNVIDRNFRINLRNSRAKWPEEDPTKPPLRLNIPKDKSVANPYNFTPQIQLNTNSEKLRTDWLTQDVRLEKTEEEYIPEFLRLNRAFEGNRNSSEIYDQNFSVRAKSSESVKYEEEGKNSPIGKVKNFKLKKIRNYEEPTPKMKDDVQSDEKNGILTIKIVLNDNEEEKLTTEMSQVETEVDVTSDEQIKALAEAILNELDPNVDNPGLKTKNTDKHDEAFLVIINVTNKDIPEDTIVKLCAETPVQNKVTESSNTSFDDGYYAKRIQVRNLDLSNEIGKNVCSKNLGKHGKMRESDIPTAGSKQVSRSLESVVGNNIALEAEFDRQVREQTQYHRSFPMESRSFKSAEDLWKEKEKRKEVFETTIRRIRATRSHIPVGKKMQAMDLSKKKLSTASTGTSNDVSAHSRLPQPMKHASEFRMQNKTMRDIGEEYVFTPQVLSKHVTLIDDVPEAVPHSEYKMLRKPCGEIKNMEDEKFKKSSTIRSYHNSCKNLCKLTQGTGEDKPPIVMNLDKKSGNTGKGDGDNHKEENIKTDPLRPVKEFSRADLDKSCGILNKNTKLHDLNGSNDIYLQEESIINDKTQRPEEKTVQKTNKIEFSKTEQDGRYELDIADANQSISPISVGVKVPYGSAYPTKRVLTGDERTRFEIFRALNTSESFEMNAKCLKKDETEVKKLPNLHSGSPVICNEETIAGTSPKISDNIGNLANEGLTEHKGPSSVDSLSMMKRVKEMVDMDLKNAEKIFALTEMEEATMENQEENILPRLPSGFTPVQPTSVVIHNEETNQYYVYASELEQARHVREQEIAQTLKNLQILDCNQEKLKEDLPKYGGTSQFLTNLNESCVLKRGDSILVYDEETRKWNVDFSLLRKKEQTKEKQQKEVLNDKNEIAPREAPPDKPRAESKEDQCLTRTVITEVLPLCDERMMNDIPEKQAETATKTIDIKRKSNKETDAKEIRKKNSDLYNDVIVGIKKPTTKAPGDVDEPRKFVKKAEGSEKPSTEHYVSENIVEMSKSNTVKRRSNKIETVKLNITPKVRPPSKVTEINLNKKNEEVQGVVQDKGSEDGLKVRKQPNGTFYKKFEKYKTPFSDPDYEDKPMKINSDLQSNPNLKKLDSWNKTLVLQEISKTSENVDGWLRDETDKVATLLLKVLQDAADGNSRRRVTGKSAGKGNPYEAIRKKQENNSSVAKGKKKEPGRKRTMPMQVNKPGDKESRLMEAEKNLVNEKSKKGQFPVLEDESHVEVLTPDSHLPKELYQVPQLSLPISRESLNDIPGPYVLKKVSSLWKHLPDLGCQTTIFLFIRMFHLAETGLSVFSSDAKKSRGNPFQRLFMKYGPVVKLQGPLSGGVILVNRPEDVNSAFEQARTSPARSVFDSVENCRVRTRKKNFPLGITRSCNGIEWDAIKKSMVDIGNKGCLQYFNMLKNADSLFVNKIHSIRNNQKQVPVDFINELKKWSMEGLCGVLFDKSLGFLEKSNSQVQWITESERLMRHLGEATDYLCQCENGFQTWRFINTPTMRGLNRAYQSLDLIISKYVYQAELTLRKKKKALTNNKSISNKNLSFLESVLLNDEMAPDEITANLIDMLLIGVNTTAIALAFFLYNLSQNNRVQCLLFKEIKGLLPTKTSTLNYHQLHSLKYLQACLKESMRLNVPIPFVLRVLPSDIALANYRVPCGTHIIMDTHTACMREQVFDEPERFKPERWLEQDCAHPFPSVPFANGPRAGFVKRLAEINLWTCIAQIVRNYQIEYHFGEIRSSKGFISYPDKPLRLTFIERMD